MAIYKVQIKREGNKISYTTNATILATVTYRAELDKYDVSTPNGSELVNSEQEADNTARKSITAFFATLRITPEFINA